MNPDYTRMFGHPSGTWNPVMKKWVNDLDDGKNHKGGTGHLMDDAKRRKLRKKRK